MNPIERLSAMMSSPPDGVMFEAAGGGLLIPHTVRPFWVWEKGRCIKRFRDVHTGQEFRVRKNGLFEYARELNG